MEAAWLTWAKQIQSIASTGLPFSRDRYDRERYEEIGHIANEMLGRLSSVPIERIESLISDFAKGYATPKVDVRGAVFHDNRIPLVREASDGLWALPGGFADVGMSASENVQRKLRRWIMARLVLTTSSMVLFALWGLGSMVIESQGIPPTQTGTRANGAAVRVTVKPDPVYVEHSELGQHLNFEFLLGNLTDEELLLTGIEVSIFDDGGRLARRDFVNRFSRTSLEIPPRRVLRAKQSTLVFNPFHSFAASVSLKRLRYEFAFATSDERVRHTSVTEVMPIVYETKTALVLPVKGRVLVWDGHDYHSHHRRMDYTLPVFRNRRMTTNFQRYGYDFIIVNEQGVMYRGAPKHSDDWYRGRPDDNEAYFAFGQPVYAAGAGRVVDVHDGEADNRRFDPTEFTKRPTAGGGNYVVIDHLNGEFSWFGHLKQGSIRVKRGQAVKQGDILGLIGASGDSLFPHLHYELRTGPGITGVEGLPSYFGGFRGVGSQALVGRGQLDTGDVVENR